MRNSRLIAAAMGMLGLGLMLVCSGARADQMDNPRFTAWQKFGVGSTASYDTTMSGPDGQQMTMQWTTKLLEKADDHVTLEASVNIMGQTHTSKQTVTAKTEKRDIKEVGTEDVQVAGKTISCKVYEGKDMMSGAPQGGAGAGGPGAPGGRGRGRGGAGGGNGGGADSGAGGAGGGAPERSGKFWVSDQVPGGLVKMTGEGPRGDVQIMLKSFEAK